MPAAEIRGQLAKLTIDRLATLKSYWKVSMQALIRRAHDLEMISDRQLRTLYMTLSANGWRKKEPVDIPLEKPSIVRSLIDVHITEHGYTIAELCDAIRIGEADFRKDYLREREPALRIFDRDN